MPPAWMGGALCGRGLEFYVEFYVWQKKQRPASLQAFDLYGAGTKSRTRDLLITSQLLYQLSYTGISGPPLYPFIWPSKVVCALFILNMFKPLPA